MSSLGDIARTFGFATISGLGTAEAQRARAEREMDRALRVRQLDEEAAYRRQQAEESRRLYDLQYGFATPEDLGGYEPLFKELGVILPPDARIRRRDIPTILGHAERARANQPVDITQAAEIAGIPFPRVEQTVTGQVPGEFGTFGEPPAEAPVTITQPPPRRMVPRGEVSPILTLRGQSARERLAHEREVRTQDQQAANALAQDEYDRLRSDGQPHGPAQRQALQAAQTRYPKVSVTKFPEDKGRGATQPIEMEGGGFQRYEPYQGKMVGVPGTGGTTMAGADRRLTQERLEGEAEDRRKFQADQKKQDRELRRNAQYTQEIESRYALGGPMQFLKVPVLPRWMWDALHMSTEDFKEKYGRTQPPKEQVATQRRLELYSSLPGLEGRQLGRDKFTEQEIARVNALLRAEGLLGGP